jgi:hypothetical protein
MSCGAEESAENKRNCDITDRYWMEAFSWLSVVYTKLVMVVVSKGDGFYVGLLGHQVRPLQHTEFLVVGELSIFL